MKRSIHRFLAPRKGTRLTWLLCYRLTIWILYPASWIFSLWRRERFVPGSVLHISYMVHVPYFMVQTLRKHGFRADYMALGNSPVWDRCDYPVHLSRWPFLRVFQEFFLLWRILSRYQIIHCHFMMTPSLTGWEWFFLKKMGRKIVIHYRGCEIRDSEKIRAAYPDVNICQECDYASPPCRNKTILRKRVLASKYGDLFLVTTPDLKIFAPRAIHFPFFTPEIDPPSSGNGREQGKKKKFLIFHATNQPGIEGTKYIRKVVANLADKGYLVEFAFVQGAPFPEVLAGLAHADLAVGKMKMGYYANGQIESLWMGVPTITYVRPEFMTEELENSGFIFSSLARLEETIEYYLNHPDELRRKSAIARASILRNHDNEKLVRQLVRLYRTA
jgi:hypothetical protein